MPDLDLKIEEIKNEMRADAKGVITFSNRGGARLLGLAESTLRTVFTPERAETHPLAQKLIAMGFDLRTISKEGIQDLVFAIIADYYAFEAGRYITEEAKLACRVFSAIGVRKWGQEILGWKPSIQSNNDQVLLLLGEMRTEINNMREEITSQNSRVNLMLPSYQMMQKIKPALSLADGKVQALMEKISQNLEDFPNQQYLPIRYFLEGYKCTRGDTISIGQAVSGFFKGFTGEELPTKYGYQKSAKVYPEYSKPIFEYVLRSKGK